ncbi:F-box domain-containing protein [Mycena chlorophos]|uniref:F-box domain-containing protein n=1 Tax=Mycena chlorophos TaxID=658473 RepID=A0A8H6VP11_MYCCL|nr:F-box domain-containing protein [Mycena chlorophos]
MANSCPLVALPTELLARIFEAYLPEYPRCVSMYPGTVDSPMFLAQICTRFKAVALATPSLWRAIDISAPHPSVPERLAPRRKATNTFLARSASCALSLNMTGFPHQTYIHDLFDLLLPHRERWEYLVLDADAAILVQLAGPLPLLRGVELSGFPHTPLALPHYEAAPLHSLCVCRINIESIASPQSLTHIHLTRYAPAECIPFLLRTPNLEFLSISLCRDSERALQPYPVARSMKINLPALHTLCLHTDDPIDTGPPESNLNFLDFLLVPSLRRLQVSSEHFHFPDRDRDPTAEARIRTFLTQWGIRSGRLEELRIFGIEFDDLDGSHEAPSSELMDRLRDVVHDYKPPSEKKENIRRQDWAVDALPFALRFM